MITLLTGRPGTGKTAYAVKMLLEDERLKDRPIFTNITGLKLPHHPIDAEWLRTWHTNAPPEAFILFDECQDVFLPRHASKEPPEFVNELTKHRKDYSVDFFLITQKPGFIDFMVRGLCSRHIHIRETAVSRMVHEAPEVVDFDDKSVRELSGGTPYKLPKHVFDLYTSAQVHTAKQKRRLPFAVYMLGLALVAAAGVGVYIWRDIFAPVVEASTGQASIVAAETGAPATVPAQHRGAHLASDVVASKVPASMIEALTPADPQNHLSAPLYAPVAPPVTAPQVVGCLLSGSRCACYSQQATPVWMPAEQCRQRALGEYYDPYAAPVRADKTGTVAPRQVEKATAPAEPGLEPPGGAGLDVSAQPSAGAA